MTNLARDDRSSLDSQMDMGAVPSYLRPFLAEQDYAAYTAMDHAAWRYIMRVSKSFFVDHAHPMYLKGLAETGITIDRIPSIKEMDDKLRRFGWRAVSITGFIPPEAFLEMLSLQLLPIACDMRKLEHIEYTPAPDIVHEAAGHAPIIADEAYASYLRKFGEIARRVIFAKEDNEVYQAVLKLSEIKEDPHSKKADIESAQAELDEAYKKVTYVSEAQQLTRLGWWTTEYGLFKKGDRFLMYGAGLLSSVGESYNCLSDKVKRIPLTLECIEQDYDITKPQPQLFYTDDFKKLEGVIEQLASRMAYKRGGVYGLETAKRAGTVTTTELDSGLQISGVLTEYRTLSGERVSFIKLTGPVQLAYKDRQLEGQGPKGHPHGFSTPLGKIKGIGCAASEMRQADFEKLGFKPGAKGRLEFESGIVLEGKLEHLTERDGKTIVARFSDCSIKSGTEVLYDPSWGTFDLGCGEKVVSVFGNAAERGAYMEEVGPGAFRARAQKVNVTAENKELVPLYAKVRSIREGLGSNGVDGKQIEELEKIAGALDTQFTEDWLLRVEMLEILATSPAGRESALGPLLRERLKALGAKSENIGTLIKRGLALIG